MAFRDALERAFNPRTVAVIGDKRAAGYMWLRSMKPFSGRLVSVQIDPAEIPGIEELGVPNYKSLLDVPEDIDYAVCAVPRQVSPRIIADCAKKGVGAVSLFTSGFAETGEETGIRLQDEVGRLAREGNLALIGPNCMGIYVRRLGVRQSAEQPAGDPGEVGFISQSGTHAIAFSLVGAVNGVRISKSVSMGNGIILEAADYLDYLADDPETRVIAMYIEGVRDGRRFFESLRRAAAVKPVVVWKGGVTEAGTRATASHTASLATSHDVWEAMVRQAGALSASSLDDTIDVVKALVWTRPATGYRVGLMAMTGGQSVVITDAFVSAGMEVPLLTAASYQRLGQFFNIIGGSYRNPLDMGGTIGFAAGAAGVDNLRKLLEIMDEDENVDAVAMEMATGFLARRWREHPGTLDGLLDALVEHRDRSSKPFVTIMHPAHVEEIVAQARPLVQDRGLPVFASFERAAGALRRLVDYHRLRAGLA